MEIKGVNTDYRTIENKENTTKIEAKYRNKLDRETGEEEAERIQNTKHMREKKYKTKRHK